ncbi:TIGR03809 family protein [Bradyrhizobium guangzhouense]|uniref:TIGR03809 family protein n=1 Tax=Bradyrhizobium guangzhouense TaxID=1325095 RepID=A0AAE5X372_9BRAD|nr:TIGR03809 family protein [Bradyrhizobium guangzhouense]QAU48092.1 TIGR03809 family protein [Bradyrhizobium guangzhouense]RXH10690.1 TIGR03809 family protein [Bradyrhizobium guangzhouense]
MTHRHNAGQGAASREIAARWCALAEQRLEHLSEMFETGRWRRYHSELAFLENIQEAKRAVQTWRALANGEDVAAAAASVTSAFGWSPATMPRVFPREQAQTVQPKAVHIEPETSVPVRLEPEPDILAEIVEAPIAPAAPMAPVAPPARVAPAIRIAPAQRIAPTAPAASIASFLQTFTPPADDIVAAPERVVEFTFSLDGIEAKYPLLRNTF